MNRHTRRYMKNINEQFYKSPELINALKNFNREDFEEAIHPNVFWPLMVDVYENELRKELRQNFNSALLSTTLHFFIEQDKYFAHPSQDFIDLVDSEWKKLSRALICFLESYYDEDSTYQQAYDDLCDMADNYLI